MFYIHETACISPQQTFGNDQFLFSGKTDLHEAGNNKLLALEPAYEGLPPGILRRMGKAVRLGVGAAVRLLQNKSQNGIIIGTSMGGMEDCIKFLNQVIEYNEGQLTPTNFVQSTPNAIAGQTGLLSKNKGYNITHVHRGFSFENAVIDADMMISENPGSSYLLGSVDEISAYNYNIERLGGWYKENNITDQNLYKSSSPGSIAGEGAAMFIVNDKPENAVARLTAIHIFHTDKIQVVSDQFRKFLEVNLTGTEKPDLFISGENGDTRFQEFYDACEMIAGENISVARFKHLSGEYPTASGFALWLACEIIKHNYLPEFIIKRSAGEQTIKRVVIYNNYKGLQHCVMLAENINK